MAILYASGNVQGIESYLPVCEAINYKPALLVLQDHWKSLTRLAMTIMNTSGIYIIKCYTSCSINLLCYKLVRLPPLGIIFSSKKSQFSLHIRQ